MAKRFNCNLQALDLNNIDKDPDLVSQKVKLLLNKKTSMEAVIKIVEGNVPRLTSLNLSNNCIQRLDELSKLVPKVPNLMALDLSQNNLQSECELDKLKGLNLVELWLVGNPLCALFKDANSYASAMCQRFPQLQKLDGTPLFQPTVIDAPSTIVSPETSFTCFNIYGFIESYYDVCDSDDRTLMLQAYYKDALFKHTKLHPSQILPMNGQDVDNPLDIDQDVVTFLNKLPKTQHDRSSFHVKVNAFTNTHLEFTLNGNYTEFEELRTNGISFIRKFVALPSDHGGLYIINDQVFTKKVTEAQISRAFVGPTTNPFSNTESAMCQTLPQLQRSDGTYLFQPTVIDAPSTIVSPETSFNGSNIYGFIERFLQNYYDVCDSDDRTLMLQAYYEDALFKHTKLHHSQILPMNGQDVDNPLDIDQDVVTFLNKLPKTQHDRSSFHINVNAFTNTRLEFTVSGNYTEFKELRTNGISFIRNFVALPSDHGGLCIINDQVFTKKVPKAQKAQISGAFVGPTTNPFFQHGKVTQRQTSAQSNDDEDW
ncbi:nuclear RNA export factor 1-like isoform X2 [Gouania willdenowi]|uniref:nuclear RNA export factor 1-like isoform X2 n=1 Tax=Gouania willdenowi TaxID=441366 RepID=UPI00105445AA|nr:nuclear RNA export factor 1-like isoform X2 [Gouania willdenowi]